MAKDETKTDDPRSLERVVSLLGKSYSIYSVLNPDNPDRMPYVLINSESKRTTTDICNLLNKLRKQANDQAQPTAAGGTGGAHKGL